MRLALSAYCAMHSPFSRSHRFSAAISRRGLCLPLFLSHLGSIFLVHHRIANFSVPTMGQPSRKKRFHRGDCRGTKGNKARSHTRDLDQIYDDLKPQDAKKPKTALPIDHDLPGLGQHYCVECARFFVDIITLNAHHRSKLHKQRVRELKTVPFTQKEADAAAGMGSYIAPVLRTAEKTVEVEMETMTLTEVEVEKQEDLSASA